jgi:UPF0176 protein
MPMIEIVAFYRFASLPDFREAQPRIRALAETQGVKGICLLAEEGVNGTLAGSPGAMAQVMAGISAILGLDTIEQKSSFADVMPFRRLKVRQKAEIVTIGDRNVDPLARVGIYVEPQDWNALISDPEVVVIDTRNHFEVEIGTFEGAVDPRTTAFNEFPEYVERMLDPEKHPKVAMFCTGGIRCEKATSYLLSRGFKDVFHLKGGILNYLARIPESESLWRGDCFVFDGRVALDHALRPTSRMFCMHCRAPLDPETIEARGFEDGVSCPHCVDTLTPDQISAARERQRQIQIANARGTSHLGPWQRDES